MSLMANNKFFPDNFLWGASTSAHQVEGDNFYNDWWQWERRGFTSASGKACDHYSLYKKDFSIAKHLGHNAHRFGIEWSRVQKDPYSWDETEWAHYRDAVDELIRLGITPLLTLNHFTVPVWIEKAGGWANSDTIGLFTNFALKALKELGDKVEYWIIFNEPHMLAFIGYFYGHWPPYRKNPREAFLILKNLLKTHVKTYKKMRETADKISGVLRPKIGIAKAVAYFQPYSLLSLKDIRSSENRDFAHNHAFISSCITGKIQVPGLKTEILEEKNTLDFIGLNYYFRQFIKHGKPFSLAPLGEVATENIKARGKITDMGWEVFPRGIYEVIKNFSKYDIPLLITENGIATTNDADRKEFIKEHLKYLLKAVNKGLPLSGYLHWSLLDNFEWAEGYTKKFGLLSVDFSSYKRTIRKSAEYYSSIIKNRRI
jgi:beta-glucosidase